MTTKRKQNAAGVIAAVKMLLEALVSVPEDIEINSAKAGSILAIEIRVNGADVPSIIGKHGRHYAAINTLVSEAGALQNLSVVFTVLEPNKGQRMEGRRPFVAQDGKAVRDKLSKMVAAIASMIVRGGVKIEASHTSTMSVFHVVPIQPEEQITESCNAALSAILDSIGKACGRIVKLSTNNENNEERK